MPGTHLPLSRIDSRSLHAVSSSTAYGSPGDSSTTVASRVSSRKCFWLTLSGLNTRWYSSMRSTERAGGKNFLHSLTVCTPLIRASDPYQSRASAAHTSVDAHRPDTRNPINSRALQTECYYSVTIRAYYKVGSSK